jgi:hypothetical protein
MKKQQPNEQVLTEKVQGERTEQQPERRRLRIEALEERVAPSAVWTD